MLVRTIDSKTAREVVEREHYLHRKPMVSHSYGLFERDELVGVVTFGTPASSHLQIGVCPGMPQSVTELNRLWVDDRMPKNSESQFVAEALGQLPASIVVSYADTAHGHLGYIYRALNFNYAGWTDMERKSARWDYVKAGREGKHTRGASRAGWSLEGGDYRVQRKPKIRYWITTGNRTERKFLEQACAWPKMSWKDEPPPTEHKVRGYTEINSEPAKGKSWTTSSL